LETLRLPDVPPFDFDSALLEPDADLLAALARFECELDVFVAELADLDLRKP